MAIVKSGFRSLYLLSAVTFGLRLLIWVATDKSGFRPLTETKIRGGVIRGYSLKEGGAYFKKRRLIHTKFENFVTFSFQTTVNKNHYDKY